jgi:C4-type Zn-finger protein
MSRVYIHILGAYVKFCEQKTSILAEMRFGARDHMIPFFGPIIRGQVDHRSCILFRIRDVHQNMVQCPWHQIRIDLMRVFPLNCVGTNEAQ